MESSQKAAVVTLLLVVVLTVQLTDAQNLCNVSMAGLMACKPAVTPPTPARPTAACCSTISRADLRCLCSYKSSPLLPSLGIDPNLAFQLPAKCNIPHPPRC